MVPMQLHLVTLWARDDLLRPETGRFRLTHFDVGGTPRKSWDLDIDLTEKRRRRVILTLGGVPVTVAGEQEFRVEYQRADDQWEVAARVPLEIRIGEETPG
jgi:hypothetical protein